MIRAGRVTTTTQGEGAEIGARRTVAVVELNRAVAVAMRDGPETGLALIDAILARGDLADYHLAHSARAELAGDSEE